MNGFLSVSEFGWSIPFYTIGWSVLHIQKPSKIRYSLLGTQPPSLAIQKNMGIILAIKNLLAIDKLLLD